MKSTARGLLGDGDKHHCRNPRRLCDRTHINETETVPQLHIRRTVVLVCGKLQELPCLASRVPNVRHRPPARAPASARAPDRGYGARLIGAARRGRSAADPLLPAVGGPATGWRLPGVASCRFEGPQPGTPRPLAGPRHLAGPGLHYSYKCSLQRNVILITWLAVGHLHSSAWTSFTNHCPPIVLPAHSTVECVVAGSLTGTCPTMIPI